MTAATRRVLPFCVRPDSWDTVPPITGGLANVLDGAHGTARRRGRRVGRGRAGHGDRTQLQDQITDLLDKGRNRLVFDLAEVSFCDSTGLSVFVRAKNSCDEAGGVVRLAAPQRGVLRILEVSGLVEVLQTYPTVEQAVAGDPTPASS